VEYNKKNNEMNSNIQKVYDNYDKSIQALIRQRNQETNTIRTVTQPVIDDMNTTIRNNTTKAQQLLHRGKATGHTGDNAQFIRPCPNNECRGFLSTRYKCGICGTRTCPQCLEIKGENHECIEENIKTAELIRKDTKPCPSCGTSISKIEGCFARDTLIPLLNGKTKHVQDVIVGDQLTGDDGESRKVLRTFTGVDTMYEVIQKYGLRYEVNSRHELVLKNPETNNVEEISTEDYAARLGLEPYHGIGSQEAQFRDNPVYVRKIDIDNYYGFELDGNRRFILSDGTICKNCNQMWCTVCKKGFDWRTRKIISNERIHNPHYFQWLRENKKDTDNTPEWGQGGGCEGLPDVGAVLEKLRDHANRSTYLSIYRNLVHLQDVVMGYYLVDQADIFTRNFNMRVKYLKKSITNDEWKRKLQQIEKSVLKKNEIYMALEMLCNTGTDVFRQVVREENIWNMPIVLNQFNTLSEYYNNQMLAIKKHYGCVVPLINSSWHIT
jgi:hypothetical protein